MPGRGSRGHLCQQTGRAREQISCLRRRAWFLPRAANDPRTKIIRGHPMSWITVLWSMNAAACLTLAGIYALVWCKQREDWAYLVLSCNAVAGAALTAFELALLHAQ